MQNSKDKEFVISFSNSLPITTLMSTTNIYSENACSSNDLHFLTRLVDSDIQVNINHNWFVGLEGNEILSNQFDFYSTLLHEIGHMLQLNHAMDLDLNTSSDDPSIMYWEAKGQGGVKRIIDIHSINAIELLRARIIEAKQQFECFDGFLFNTLPPSCPSTVITESPINYEFLTIPKLLFIGEEISLKVETSTMNPVKLKALLYDSYGHLLDKISFTRQVTFSTNNLTPGMYYVKVFGKKQFQISKIVLTR